MKQIFEVGDRVELVAVDNGPDGYVGTTGTVSYVSDEPHEDGTYTITYVLDQWKKKGVPMGFTCTVSSANLKYLEPETEGSKAMGEIKVGDTVRVVDWVNSTWADKTGKVTSISPDLANPLRDRIWTIPTGAERPVVFERSRLNLLEAAKPVIKVGDTVRVRDHVNNAHAGLTGRVTSIAESLWGRDRDAVTFVFGTPELPVCFERKWLEKVEAEQVAEDEGARVLKRARSKAARQQVKAAEKMRLAARYLNDLAEKCENGQRVESLRNEMELLGQAQFFLGQADALRDLEEWIGETDGE